MTDWHKDPGCSVYRELDRFFSQGNQPARLLLAWTSCVFARPCLKETKRPLVHGTRYRLKAADLAVLEKNLFEVDPTEIAGVKVDQTWLEGRLIFERAD